MARRRTASQALPEVLTVRQFAALYQISEGTVNQLCVVGKLPAFKIPTVSGKGVGRGKGWRIRNDYRTLQQIPELRENYILRECEVAELLKMTPRNVRYLCQDGRLKFRWHRSVRRFSVKDVHEFLCKPRRTRPAVRPAIMDIARDQLAALDAMG